MFQKVVYFVHSKFTVQHAVNAGLHCLSEGHPVRLLLMKMSVGIEPCFITVNVLYTADLQCILPATPMLF